MFYKQIRQNIYNVEDQNMTDYQKQIVLGGLLGNSYICKGRKNDYLCIRHSVNHLPWLRSKALELKDYSAKTPWYQYETTCTWRSRSDSIFSEFRKLCYPNGEKEVSMKWLDPLRDIAIAIWYGDSGCLTGRNGKNACLRTQSFGLDGNNIIAKYFNEVGLSCGINKSRKSYVIVFSVKGTKKLMDLISPCLPNSRYFKLAI